MCKHRFCGLWQHVGRQVLVLGSSVLTHHACPVSAARAGSCTAAPCGGGWMRWRTWRSGGTCWRRWVSTGVDVWVGREVHERDRPAGGGGLAAAWTCGLAWKCRTGQACWGWEFTQTMVWIRGGVG